MTPPGLLFAAAALVPAMTGSPDATTVERTGPLALALCAGGSMMQPLGPRQSAPGTAPCCAKGCHAARRRRSSVTR